MGRRIVFCKLLFRVALVVSAENHDVTDTPALRHGELF